jgi:carbon dioxide concentrating mechanism protein CcmN
MSVPPLRLSTNFDSYISGEVIIHPSAVIAPGVILQAAPNSKIIIGPGVCIGMGSILQVDNGTLEVEAGSNLGAGFLMVGKGTIGTNACIGSATTVFNCSVEPGQVVAPGSILGDTSRLISFSEMPANEMKQPEPLITNPASTSAEEQKAQGSMGVEQEKQFQAQASFNGNFAANKGEEELNSELNTPLSETTENSPLSTQHSEATQPSESPSTESSNNNNFGAHIYGQGSIQRLLVTLFPHRQSLNKPLSDDEQSE